MTAILKNKEVKIRKPHVCFGCGREFNPPARMHYIVYVDMGLESYYACQSCAKIIQKMRYDDEFGYGDLREEALSMERGE